MDETVKVPDSRVRLLPRFYLVLVLVLITLFTATSTGFGLFTRLLNILTLTILFSYTWNWLSLRSLHLKVNRNTLRCKVGDLIEEEIVVENQGWLTKYDLEIENTTDLPGYAGGIAVTLKKYSTSTWVTKSRARKRGIYRMGPMRVTNTDPFGLFRRERHFCDADTLTIYPRTLNLPDFELPSTESEGESVTRKHAQNITPYASSVREYLPGDSLNRVHWKSTARLGRLMSKDFDLDRAAEIWVVIDLHRYVQSGELENSTDEYAVTIGASIIDKYLRAALPVGLIAYGEERYFFPARVGSGQLDQVMRTLAISNAQGNTSLETVLSNEEQLWGNHSSLIVITSSPHLEWTVALGDLTKRGVKITTVLLDSNSFGGYRNTLEVVDQLKLQGQPIYVVKQGDDIPSVLAARGAISSVSINRARR